MTDGRRPGPRAALAVLAGILILMLAAAGCSEDPTEANALVASLPLADLVVRDTTIVAKGSSTFRQFIPLDGRINQVGRNGNYIAAAALTFYPQLFPFRDTAVVYSAKLKLRCVTWFGDSSGQFSFNVYRINRGWTQTGLTWDTVQAGFYEESVVRGTSVTGAGPDTQTVTVSLDTAMVREWLRSYTTLPTANKYGILLSPTPSCTIVRGFTAFEYDSTSVQPQLEIIAGSPAGPQRDTVTYFQGIDTFVGNIDNLNSNPQLIYVQAGVDYRASLAFDIAFIPRGAIINSAELLLQRDPATSRIPKFTTDTAIAVQTLLSAADFSQLDGGLSTGRRKTGTSLTFAVDVRRPVQIWLRGPNYGLVLRPSGLVEYSAFDLLTFSNERASNAALRPRLKIIYSTPREGARP